ncbi:MAG: hypothetical protein R2731_12455 [Nocardioides sp.]
MEGEPEGTADKVERPPTWLLAVMVVFALYLGFRLVEGIAWIVGKL